MDFTNEIKNIIFCTDYLLSTKIAAKIFTVADPASPNMKKQVLVTKEYIVNLTESKQSTLAKARKGTLEPTDLITKVVIVEGDTAGAPASLTASELAEILDMYVGGDTNRTKQNNCTE